jgi:hypothetical protein
MFAPERAGASGRHDLSVMWHAAAPQLEETLLRPCGTIAPRTFSQMQQSAEANINR